MKNFLSNQRGYLWEVPILFVVIIVVLSILLPHLPLLGQKILICLAAVPMLFLLYYMIVIPGWMPDDKARLNPPWNLLVFLLVATIIIFVVVMIILNVGDGLSSQ